MALMRIEGKAGRIGEYRTVTKERSTAYCASTYDREEIGPRTGGTGPPGVQGTFDFETKKHERPEGLQETPTTRQAPHQPCAIIVETMVEGALILSLDGIIRYCNRGFARMIGLPPEGLEGSPFSRLVLPEHLERFDDMFRRSGEDGAHAEVALRSEDGGSLAVYLSGSARVIDDEAAIILIATDIATRVRTENDSKQTKEGLDQAVRGLQESLALYMDLYENANDIIFTLDLKGNFTSANRTTYRELGFEPETVIGKNFLEIFTPESAAFASVLIEKALINKLRLLEEQPWEFEAVTKGGSVINVETRARFIWEKEMMVGIQCIARNITERKQVEMQLTRLATAIEQAVEGVIILDKSGKIQYANSAFFRTSGYGKEEVFGKSPAFLKTNKKDDGTFYRGLLNTVNTKSVWTGRISSRKRDGSIYEADMTISPVRDKSGKIVNYVAVERDVTEEVRLESQLRQMQKMEAIGTLAGGIAHDFNNILSAIIGFSEMAIEDIDEGHPAKNYAAQILKAAVRGKDLVRQILMFSHKSEEDRKHFKLSLIVKEAMKLIRASLPSTIEIRERIEVESGVIFASATQVHQVLMNLCTNAGHSMRTKGGVLEIGLSQVDVDSAADIPYPGMQPGPYLKVSVADTGIGMDRATMERIFDPFFTTKSPSEGTGMGLAVVHGIVKSHGGAITVRSTVGRGSVFDVYFPRTDTTDAEEIETLASSQRGTERILLVDDEDAIIEMGRSMIERLGYQVQVVSDGQEALTMFCREPNAFDLVITDHTMPRMTGTELARELMAVRPDIPVILCTGYSEMVSRETAKEMGIRELVMKPMSRSELAETIRRVLDDREEQP